MSRASQHRHWLKDELVKCIELLDMSGIILKPRRFGRKLVTDGHDEWIPTQAIVLTLKGQFLSRVNAYHSSISVEAYYLPIIQCLNCYTFGHIKTQCRSKQHCYKCKDQHLGDDCAVLPKDSSCLQDVSIDATYKSCSEQARQKQIKMTQDNISYRESSSCIPPVSSAHIQK